MQEEFWQSRWQENRIAFHEPVAHPFLEAHFDALDLDAGNTVLVPLCGKTLDIDWLLARGVKVVGIEFHQAAVEEVFARLGLLPEQTEANGLKCFHHGNLTLYVGDFFALPQALLGDVHAIFDRGALVALPEEIRIRYAAQLADITQNAPQLLISYDYDQRQTEGPPFSIPQSAVEQLYESIYRCSLLAERTIEGPLAERCSGIEYALHLGRDKRGDIA
ncbi:MAG: thiopurine S-methyltransferase [Pseudomonadota bacterium]